MFRRRFWWSLLLTVPVVLTSEMVMEWLGYELDFPGIDLVGPVLGTVILLWAGWPFLSGGWDEARGRRPGMMLLIAMAVTVAYTASMTTSLVVRRRTGGRAEHGVQGDGAAEATEARGTDPVLARPRPARRHRRARRCGRGLRRARPRARPGGRSRRGFALCKGWPGRVGGATIRAWGTSSFGTGPSLMGRGRRGSWPTS
jgi:hypothetical protein